MAQTPPAPQSRERRDERRPAFDQGALILVMWFVPLSLFLYVGYNLSAALGVDWLAMAPALELWKLAVLVALGFAALSFALVWRSRQAKRQAETSPSRWDSYTTPF